MAESNSSNPIPTPIADAIEKIIPEYWLKRNLVIGSSDPAMTEALYQGLQSAHAKGFFDGIAFLLSDPRAEILRNKIRCTPFTTVN